MITKLLSALIIVAVIFGGWELYLYWEKFSDDRDLQQKQATQGAVVPEQLAGMPSGWEPMYQAAVKQGPVAVRNWIKQYGKSVKDPRMAWIELDYMVMIAREDPAEARKLFADVKSRTTESSPVYKRVKELEKTYQ